MLAAISLVNLFPELGVLIPSACILLRLPTWYFRSRARLSRSLIIQIRLAPAASYVFEFRALIVRLRFLAVFLRIRCGYALKSGFRALRTSLAHGLSNFGSR